MAYTIRQYQTKSGKRYEVRYRKPDGSSTGRRGFRRKMDADAWGAANVTTAKSVGAYIDPQAGRRLVEDFWEPWLAAKKTKAKPSYIKSLEDAWRVHVEPQWGMREMQSITRDEVQRWVTDLAGRRSASVTIRAENLLRVPLEALFQTARNGGFPLFSNGFQTFLIHSNSLQITSFLYKTWAKCGHGITRPSAVRGIGAPTVPRHDSPRHRQA